MKVFQRCFVFALAVIVVSGADAPGWLNKPVAQWDEHDATELLAESPWVGTAPLQPLPFHSPDQRRESGDWDTAVGHGVGLAGTGLLGPKRMEEAEKRAHEQPSPGVVALRWESAMPVRTAEEKLGQTPASALHTGWYAIAVYNVPVPKHWKEGRLKGLALIRRESGPDFKPAKVEMKRHADGTADVVYLFPRHEEITKRERNIIFAAQLGQLFISRYFHPIQMQIAGQLEL